MTLRRALIVGVGVVVLYLAPNDAMAQGIPVFDDTNLVEWIQSIQNEIASYALQAKQFATQNLQWLQQVQSYATQVQQYAVEAEQLYGFIHAPNLGAVSALLNATGLGNSLPVNANAMLGLVDGFQYGGGGLPQIAGLAAALSGITGTFFTQNYVYTPTDGSWASQQLIARGNGIAGAQGSAGAALTDFQAHSTELAALRTHLATATTPKDVQDTQAQIELENVWNVNEMGKQIAIQAAAANQTNAAAQRDNEKLDQDIETFVRSSPVQP